jgi:WD40 repeat protein
MAVHPDGDCVWIGGTVLSLWSLRQGRLLGSFGQPGALIELVACCPSGERVLTVCRDRTARVWSTLTGQQIARWDGEDPFGAGAFGPGGRIILGDDVGRMTLLELTQLPPRSA